MGSPLPRLRVHAAATAAVIAVAGGGCAAILGVDFDGQARSGSLDGGGDGGATTDAEGGARDAGPSFCDEETPTPDFCADFDRGDFLRVWSSVFVNPWLTGNGRVTADETEAHSAPRSLRAETPTLFDLSRASAYVGVDLDPLLPYVTLRTWLRIETEQLSGAASVDLVSMTFGELGEVLVRRDAQGTSLVVVDRETSDGGGGVTTARFSAPLVVGRWMDLGLAFENRPGQGQVIAFLGGPVAELPLPASFLRVVENGYRVRVGIVEAAGSMGDFRVHFDDVRVVGNR